MKKITKRVLLSLAAVLSIAGVVGLYNGEKIARLWNVNSLFDEDLIVSNFSSMRSMFLTADLENSGAHFVWPKQLKPIAEKYRYEGKSKLVATWIEQTKTTSLLVIKDGKVVSEEYYLGTNPDDKRISWSMAKSFLSAAFGVAVGRGDIKDLDQQVTDYVSELRGSVYDGATIRNVLHMASGVQFDENYLDYYSDINRMGRILALGGSMDEFAAGLEERQNPPGQVRQYTSIDTHILSMVLRNATGKSLVELMGANIASMLGMGDGSYYLTDGYGVAFALGGINMTTRDYAKFGQMYLDRGKWEGQQVVPENWAIESTQNNAPASIEKEPLGYGYQWWLPRNANDEFFALGIYGQYIYVDRHRRTLIVKTSAHREFRNDGTGGNRITHETIEMFRAIARGLD